MQHSDSDTTPAFLFQTFLQPLKQVFIMPNREEIKGYIPRRSCESVDGELSRELGDIFDDFHEFAEDDLQIYDTWTLESPKKFSSYQNLKKLSTEEDLFDDKHLSNESSFEKSSTPGLLSSLNGGKSSSRAMNDIYIPAHWEGNLGKSVSIEQSESPTQITVTDLGAKSLLSPSPSPHKTSFRFHPYPRPQIRSNTLTCLDRKRAFLSINRPLSLTRAMKAWQTKTEALLDPFRSDGECWFHPNPPPPRASSQGPRPVGNINRNFTWTNDLGRHSLNINYGICVKLIHHELNKQQEDGWVQRQWHLSHLCGNWSCVNPRHTTVEPGGVNISRNSCFAHRDGCVHVPPCMKDHKANLGIDGKLTPKKDRVEERIRRTYHWRNWWDWDEVLQKFIEHYDEVEADAVSEYQVMSLED